MKTTPPDSAYKRKLRLQFALACLRSAGETEPLIDSPDPHILINQFRGGGEVVYTLFNNTYETRRLTFRGRTIALPPRGLT